MTQENNRNIQTSRLFLRPFIQSDLDNLFALNNDEETMKYISPPLNKAQVAGVIDWFISEWERLGYGWFAVFEKETGDFIGQCGLQCLEGKQDAADVELAFVIAKNHWRQGYATEAAQAVLTFGINNAGLRRIVAVTMEQNMQSQRVLDKLHFQFEENRKLYDRTVKCYALQPASGSMP